MRRSGHIQYSIYSVMSQEIDICCIRTWYRYRCTYYMPLWTAYRLRKEHEKYLEGVRGAQ